MTITKFLVVVLFALGCGVSPEMADEALENTSLEQFCGNEGHAVEEVEKFFQPDGYGVVGGASFGCSTSGQWEGLVCQLPFSKQFRMKVAPDGQNAAWVQLVKDARTEVLAVADFTGWGIEVYDGAAPFQFRTGTTDPEGVFGRARFNEVETIVAGSQGVYRIHHRCLASVYKQTIEGYWLYQSASEQQRKRFVKNMYKHEMYHCLGMPHSQGTTDKLMSQAFGWPSPWFDNSLAPTSAEQQRMADFEANY